MQTHIIRAISLDANTYTVIHYTNTYIFLGEPGGAADIIARWSSVLGWGLDAGATVRGQLEQDRLAEESTPPVFTIGLWSYSLTMGMSKYVLFLTSSFLKIQERILQRFTGQFILRWTFE